MATASKRVSSVSVSINPKQQNVETVNKLVALALGRAGCEKCGRLAFLDFKFLGDPGPDFEKLGGISVQVQER